MTISRPKSANERIILALDVNSLEETEKLVTELKDYVGYFKVGLQLFTACGFDSVKLIKDLGGKVFFDGKFHDIPNTVAKASANLIKNGVDFFDVHIKGGSKMLKTTAKLTKETAKRFDLNEPAIFGVTLLSSFGQRTLTEELSVNTNIEEYVEHLTQVAIDAGLDGIIAGAEETLKLKEKFGDDLLVMCPAIRPTWSIVNDQIRVVTPSYAVKQGVDFMIVGRPVTDANNPKDAIYLILDEIDEAETN